MRRGVVVGVVVLAGLAGWRPARAQDLTTQLSLFLVDLRNGTLGATQTVTTVQFGPAGVYGPFGIVGQGRATGQTTTVASVATYTPGSDQTLELGANLLLTTATSCTFNVQATYTDEGNTSRTMTLTFTKLDGSQATSITNTLGAVPLSFNVVRVRAKSGTAVTVLTSGTVTTCTYNVDASIVRVL